MFGFKKFDIYKWFLILIISIYSQYIILKNIILTHLIKLIFNHKDYLKIYEKVGSNSYTIALFETFSSIDSDHIFYYLSKNDQLIYLMRTRYKNI